MLNSIEMNIYIFGIMSLNLLHIRGLPIVQPGLFVISGVGTCGHGTGYCLLGIDCTINDDFLSDEKGHCNGLRTAFTPEAYFSCCRYITSNASSFSIVDDMTLPPTSTVTFPQTDEPNFGNTENIDFSEVELNYLNKDRESQSENGINENAEHRDVRMRNERWHDARSTKVEKIVDLNHVGCSNTFLSQNCSNVTFDVINVDSKVPSVPTGVNEMNLRKMNVENFNVNENGAAATFVPVQNFKNIFNILLADTRSERDCSRHRYAELFPLPPPSHDRLQDNNSNSSKETFERGKCLNLTNNTKASNAECVNIWKFVSNNKLLCFGTLINSVWLLTSASCITKIFHDGMDSIVATDIEETGGLYGISNMIVHENYKTEEMTDVNDIGLVSLNKIANASCFGCLPKEERKYADKSCTTYTIVENQKNKQTSLTTCQDRLKILNMHSKMYLSLPCSSDGQRTLVVDDSTANALWCDNSLVGIETSFDDGFLLFTPISEHADWIQQNVQLYL